MTLRCGILTLKTSDSFFRSFRFLRQNEAFSATEQNLTYNYSFFFIIVFLQFSIKFYFSGCLVLITNSKLVIYIGKRRGFSRRFWLLIKELFRDKKIARDTGKRNRTPYINVSFLEFDFLESHIFLEMFILTNKNHRLLDNPLFFPQTKILIPY